MRVLQIMGQMDTIMRRQYELVGQHPDINLFVVQANSSAPAETPPLNYTVVATPKLYFAHDPHRAFYRSLTLAMNTVRPDLIHAVAEPDSLLAVQVVLAQRLLAPRSQVILHTWQNVARSPKIKVRLVLGITLRNANSILCANQAAVRLLRHLGYQGQTAVIAPVGVNTQVFKPLETKNVAPGLPTVAPESTFMILFFGRLVAEKGLDLLIEALCLLPKHAHLVLVGNGPEKASLMQLGTQLGMLNRVQFIDRVPPEQIPKILSKADVAVLPSCSTPVWQEQFGRALVEAMACKVPVIGSDSGAIPEVIGDAGMIFPEGDSKALAGCIAQLMASGTLRHELAERGFARVVQHYTQERIAEKTIRFYLESMGATAHGKERG